MKRALYLCLLSTLLTLGCNVSDPITQRPVDEDTGSEPDVTETDMGVVDMTATNAGNNDAGNNGTDMGGDDVGVDMGSSTTFEEYCDAVGRRQAQWYRDCWNTTSDPDDAEFIANLVQNCMRTAPAVEAGHVSFAPDAADTCIAAFDDLTCDNFAFLNDFAPCEDVLTANQMIGDPCYPSNIGTGASQPCAEGYCFQNACPGECTTYAGIGEDCGGSPYVQCDPNANLWCNSNTDRCESRLAIGVNCSNGFPCREGLVCLYGRTDVVCAQGLELGDTCDTADDRCTNNTFCSDGVCKSKVETGEQCRYPYQCPYGDSCIDSDGTGPDTEPGVCRARGAGGATCYDFFEDCQSGFYCMNNTCVALPTGGEACANDRCAPGFWCRHENRGDVGICRTIGGVNEDCSHGYGSADVYRGCDVANDIYCIQGTCRAPGAVDEPCSPNTTITCNDGLFCRRGTNVCTAFAAENEPCNPWWYPQSCQDGLGCSCDPASADCGSYNLADNLGDTCQPIRTVGDACELSSECEGYNCWDHDSDGANSCQPGVCAFP